MGLVILLIQKYYFFVAGVDDQPKVKKRSGSIPNQNAIFLPFKRKSRIKSNKLRI